ncbi:MAG: hypothetical protein U0269_24960 [Polyangiales bacterium]
MKKSALLVIAAVVAALTGCGGPAPAGSCQANSGGVTFCIDYTGSAATMAGIQQGCSQSMGTYQASACPTANRVGRCTLPNGSAQLTQTASYYAPMTSADVMAACTAIMGTYQAN